MNPIIKGFLKYMGEGSIYTELPKDVINKYEGEFITEKDKIDVINLIWREFGLRGYKEGLFWLVNPDEYSPIAQKFHSVSSTSIVFARSACGGLFLWDRMEIGDSILYLNVHTGNRNIISTSFEVFFEWNITATSFWKRECYGKIELKAVEKHGSMTYNECFAFVPALALGGNESVAKMEKVKIKEHLNFLAQLHNGE